MRVLRSDGDLAQQSESSEGWPFMFKDMTVDSIEKKGQWANAGLSQGTREWELDELVYQVDAQCRRTAVDGQVSSARLLE